MISTNKQVQSMREQLNNQSSKLSKSQLFQAAFLSKIKMRNLNNVQSVIAELGTIASYLNDVYSLTGVTLSWNNQQTS